jgi:hypothetical protein
MRTMTTVIILLGMAAEAAADEPTLSIEETRLTVRTRTAMAVFDGPSLVSLRGVSDDVEFVQPSPGSDSLDLYYLHGDARGEDKQQRVTVTRLSDRAARIVVEGADSRRTLLVAADEATGDVLVTPGGMSNRRGLRSVGWKVPLDAAAKVILPVVNGLQVVAGEAHPGGGRFPWPFKWEAQLAIAERDGTTLMIHAEDRAMQFKALRLGRPAGRTELTFESEPPGPLWDNRVAGGIEWRLNVYPGDWQVPALRYRQWLDRVRELPTRRAGRPDWVDRISLAVCWSPSRIELLEPLAELHPPDQTLIHLSDWRTEGYDIQYPDYTPSDQARAFVAQARSMGFHVMPHFNFWAVYYEHPFFQQVRDFQIRSVDRNEPEGWHWPPDTHAYTRMGYIHPGLGLWRDKLIDVVLAACDELGTDIAFIDQTLCTWNTDNGLVEGMNTVAALALLQEQFATVRPDLLLVGEGLNEISFQRQCFAQAHIHDGWVDKLGPHHLAAAHPICSFLWKDHTRLVGYHHLNPANEEDFQLGIDVYDRMGAIPTLITGNPEHLREPSPATKRLLDLARRGAVSDAETSSP